MDVEPLANIRDGVLVERLVKTMRYIADMRVAGTFSSVRKG